MTPLNTLLDPTLLAEMVAGGYVRVQTHPTLPLAIYNYSEKAAYEHVWNDVTRTCRGLIVDQRTSEVIARPFPKFFNHGEVEAGTLDMTAPTIVTDKADGSLGILFASDGQWHIATRGSFASVQAQHATKLYRERYADQFTPSMQWTHLFEIVYPDNRIVLDYDGLDDLIHLGTVHIATGETTAPNPAWPGRSVEEFPYPNLASALVAEPRPNAEGLVVHFPATDTRLKIKQADYVALHRIITQTSARVLWEYLAVNACLPYDKAGTEFLVRKLMLDPARIERVKSVGANWFLKFLEGVPDEFFAWIKSTTTGMLSDVAQLRSEIESELSELQEESAGVRKVFASLASKRAHRGALFAMLDGYEIETYLWRQVYPAHDLPFMTRHEEAA